MAIYFPRLVLLSSGTYRWALFRKRERFDVTRDDTLGTGVSCVWFLLLDRNWRVLGSGATWWDIRLRLTADIVTLDEVLADSLDRFMLWRPFATDSTIGYYPRTYQPMYWVGMRRSAVTFLGRPTLFFTGGLGNSKSVWMPRSCVFLPRVWEPSDLREVENP